MKHLFSPDHRYTEEALVIDGELADALAPIFKKYKHLSPRELALIAHGTVNELMLEAILISQDGISLGHSGE